jgi:hypothetical protein
MRFGDLMEVKMVKNMAQILKMLQDVLYYFYRRELAQQILMSKVRLLYIPHVKQAVLTAYQFFSTSVPI